jgi:hypothetical protein
LIVSLDGLVDEVWFTVSPYLWATGPRIFDDVGAVRLELVATTTFPSGVVRLCYRPAPADTPSTGKSPQRRTPGTRTGSCRLQPPLSLRVDQSTGSGQLWMFCSRTF